MFVEVKMMGDSEIVSYNHIQRFLWWFYQ